MFKPFVSVSAPQHPQGLDILCLIKVDGQKDPIGPLSPKHILSHGCRGPFIYKNITVCLSTSASLN